MIYYIRETADSASKALESAHRKTAAFKPRVDVDTVLSGIAETPVDVPLAADRTGGILHKIARHGATYRAWRRATSSLRAGDTLVLQYPLLVCFLKQNKIFRRLKKRGVTLVILAHDVNWFRVSASGIRAKLKEKIEKKTLRFADILIVHNEKMAALLRGELNAKFVSLGIFDYLAGEALEKRANERHALPTDPIAVAGNLSPDKARYAYSLPENVHWNLYGPYFEGGGNSVHYAGAFPPDELPLIMEGSFGLVWDGETTATCSGSYGEYLRYNDPHKCSLYLACGMPVIIWKEAALAEFVTEHDCGITVSDLAELPAITSSMSEERYRQLCANAAAVGALLRKGYFTEKALKNAFEKEN